MTSQPLGLKIKTLRENAGLSQAQIAQLLEVDQSLISKCENGERQFQIDHLERLGDLFGLPLGDLVDEKAPAAPIQIAFRTDGMQVEDLKAIADVQKIALNLNQMRMLLQEGADEAQA